MHILNILETKKDHDEYVGFINTTLLAPYELTMLEIVSEWYEQDPIKHTHIDSWKSFKTHILYGSGKTISSGDAHRIEALCESLDKPSSTVTKKDIIDQFYTRKYATLVASAAMDIVDGDTSSSVEDLFNQIEEWKDSRSHLIDDSEGEGGIAIDDDFIDHIVTSPAGESWALSALNECMGPLSNALIVVGARPDVGKTTFILNEAIHFAERFFYNGSKKKICFFGNEESVSRRIIPRVAAMVTNNDPALLVNPSTRSKVLKEFMEWMDKYESPFRFYNSESFTADDVERFSVVNDAGLIVIDQLAKVNGYEGKGSDVDRFAKVVKHIRRIAAEIAPVMGTVWADYTAEGEAYPNMAQLYGSKTALQGEADVILTLGKVHTGNTPVRYMSCVKNKVPYGDASKSNGRWELSFDPVYGTWS